jgi:hypothetical protein
VRADLQRAPLTVRAAYGLLLLSAPQLLLRIGAESRTPGWAPSVVRLLGARHLLQARVLAVHPGLAGPGAAVDLMHALSDVVEAAADRRLRTPALVDAAAATGLALSCLVVVRPLVPMTNRKR